MRRLARISLGSRSKAVFVRGISPRTEFTDRYTAVERKRKVLPGCPWVFYSKVGFVKGISRQKLTDGKFSPGFPWVSHSKAVFAHATSPKKLIFHRMPLDFSSEGGTCTGDLTPEGMNRGETVLQNTPGFYIRGGIRESYHRNNEKRQFFH